jgi:hypothetical protein
MPETMAQMITAVAKRAGFHLLDVATGGTTTTLNAAKLIHRDGYWTGKYIYFLSGSNAGLERIVTGYTNHTLAFDACPYNVAAGDQFEIAEIARDDLVLAVQGAIGAAGSSWMRIVSDESMTLDTDTMRYEMPDDLVSILSIDMFYTDDVALESYWLPVTDYEFYGAPGARTLMVRQFPESHSAPASSYPMRVQYLALPTMLSEAADGLDIGLFERDAVAYIKEMALHYINEQRFQRNRTGEDARACLTAAQQHMAKAESIRERAHSAVGTRRYKTRQLPRHI